MGALLTGNMGTPEKPINDSKGCGGVMRVAPIGLVSEAPFDVGCRAAAITHGHPSGWIAAGAFALIISEILDGCSMRDAVRSSISSCQSVTAGGEVVHALKTALQMVDEGERPTPERVETLGGGWVAGRRSQSRSIACSALLTLPPLWHLRSTTQATVTARGASPATSSGPCWVSVGSTQTCWSS
jgi:hypothetical protein